MSRFKKEKWRSDRNTARSENHLASHIGLEPRNLSLRRRRPTWYLERGNVRKAHFRGQVAETFRELDFFGAGEFGGRYKYGFAKSTERQGGPEYPREVRNTVTGDEACDHEFPGIVGCWCGLLNQ